MIGRIKVNNLLSDLKLRALECGIIKSHNIVVQFYDMPDMFG